MLQVIIQIFTPNDSRLVMVEGEALAYSNDLKSYTEERQFLVCLAKLVDRESQFSKRITASTVVLESALVIQATERFFMTLSIPRR